MAVAMCGKCRKFISLSAIPGGNPIALEKPDMFATRYAKCAHCGGLFCDECVRSNGEKCPACGRKVNLEGEVAGAGKKEHPTAGRTCTSCGEDLPEGTRFCLQCGARLAGGAPATDLGDQTVAAQPDATRPAVPASPPEADQDAQTRLAASPAVNTDQAQVKEQAVPSEWKVGDEILDLYEVKDLLGEGGFGRVYRVHHSGWNIDLALKSPRSIAFETSTQRENFVRECETWIQLGMHPHIVSCYYVRTIGEVPHVFAEYVEGGSLHEWIEDRRLYEGGEDEALRRILDISIQFAWGLHYAHTHEQGLIHQDVKPANVLITTEGEAKVTDFGLARARAAAGEVPVAEGSGRTVLVPGAGMITPAFCSPEQAEGKPLSRKTDIWSWALSVLEMFTGGRTWRSGTLAMVALSEYRKTGAEDESIPRMPDSLAELLNECFQQEPKDRPDSFKEIADKLRAIYHKDGKDGEYPREEPRPADLLADSLNNRALSMLDLGRKGEAEKLYDKAINSDPHHAEAMYNRGVLLWRSTRISDVTLIEQLEAAYTLRSRDIRYLYLLGLVHVERGDFKSAAENLKSYLAQCPKDIEAKSLLKTATEENQKQNANLRIFKPIVESNIVVSLSHDRRLALAGGSDGSIQLYTTSEGATVRTFAAYDTEVRCLAFSSHGEFFVSCSTDGVAKLWDIDTGEYVRILSTQGKNVRTVSFSPDGNFLLWGHSQSVCLSRLPRGEVVWSMGAEDSMEYFNRPSFSPCGGFVLISTTKKLILRKCVPSEWRIALQTSPRPGYLSSAAISPDGRFVLSGSNKDLVLVEIDTRNNLWETQGAVASVAFSSDGRLALTGGKNTCCWDVCTGRRVRTIKIQTSWTEFWPNDEIALLNEGSRLSLCPVGAGKKPIGSVCCVPVSYRSNSPSRELRKLRFEAKSLLKVGDAAGAYDVVREAISLPGCSKHAGLLDIRREAGMRGVVSSFCGGWQRQLMQGVESAATAVALSSNGRWLAGGTEEGHLQFWELTTQNLIGAFPEHGLRVTAMAFTGDNRNVVTVGLDGTARMWEAATCRRMKMTRLKPITEVWSLALFPDHRFAVCGGKQGSLLPPVVVVFDLSTGRSLRTFEGALKPLAISADARYGLFNYRLWDLGNNRCLRSLENYSTGLEDVVFSPDGQYVLGGGGTVGKKARGHLCVWRVNTGAKVREMLGHASRVNCIAVSLDSRFVVSGSGDGTIRLWELDKGSCLETFRGHTGSVTGVAISKDSRTVASCSSDGTLRTWELEWEYEFPDPTDWDKGAEPYLETFLTLHTPYASNDPMTPEGLTRSGHPSWTEEDFAGLIQDLQYAGYGWLRPEGVKHELKKMASSWEGPPPLPGE